MFFFFFFNDTATTEIYTYLHPLSPHDALPISSTSPRSAAPRDPTPRPTPAPSQSSATGSRGCPKARRAAISQGASASTSRAGGVKPAPATDLSRSRCTRSEEHTSELQSLMRISYAVFCLKKTRHIHKKR